MERQKGTSAIGSGPLCNRVSDAYSNVSAGQCADPVFVKTTVNCGGRRVGPGFAEWRLIPQRAAASVGSPMDAHVIVNIVPKGFPETLSVLGDLVDGRDNGSGIAFEGLGGTSAFSATTFSTSRPIKDGSDGAGASRQAVKSMRKLLSDVATTVASSFPSGPVRMNDDKQTVQPRQHEAVARQQISQRRGS